MGHGVRHAALNKCVCVFVCVYMSFVHMSFVHTEVLAVRVFVFTYASHWLPQQDV